MKEELYVIGDVHGCYDTLMALIEKIKEKSPKYKLCFTGDLIDRGPKSRQVVEFVKDNNHDCVLGNHELMCVQWNGKWSDQLWLLNGGDKTLDSYHEKQTEPPFIKGEINQELFDEHRNWMASLPLVKEYEDYKTPSGKNVVVSHSLCINQWKHIKAGKEMTDHVVWNRKFHELDTVDFINFIGHTIEPYNPKVDNQKYINVDTGAFLGTKSWIRYKCQGNEGNLTAINVETLEYIMQECIDE